MINVRISGHLKIAQCLSAGITVSKKCEPAKRAAVPSTPFPKLSIFSAKPLILVCKVSILTAKLLILASKVSILTEKLLIPAYKTSILGAKPSILAGKVSILGAKPSILASKVSIPSSNHQSGAGKRRSVSFAPKARHLIATAVRPWIKSRDQNPGPKDRHESG